MAYLNLMMTSMLICLVVLVYQVVPYSHCNSFLHILKVPEEVLVIVSKFVVASWCAVLVVAALNS